MHYIYRARLGAFRLTSTTTVCVTRITENSVVLWAHLCLGNPATAVAEMYRIELSVGQDTHIAGGIILVNAGIFGECVRLGIAASSALSLPVGIVHVPNDADASNFPVYFSMTG